MNPDALAFLKEEFSLPDGRKLGDVLPDLQRDAAEALDRMLPPALRRLATGV